MAVAPDLGRGVDPLCRSCATQPLLLRWLICRVHHVKCRAGRSIKPSADISASRQLPGWPGQAVAPPISRYDGLRHVPTKRRGVLKEPQGQTLPGAEEATEVEREGQQCWQSSCAQHPRPDCELCAAWKLPGLLLWGPAVAATAGVVQAETLSWLEPGSWLRNGPKLQGSKIP